jgi:PAS domain S-box-containing protein
MSLANDRLWVLRLSCRRIAAVFVLISLAPYASSQQHAKNVLVINSTFDRRTVATLDLIEAPVRARFADQVNFYTTYLSPQKIQDDSYRNSMAETIRHQYSDVKFDVVIAGGVPAIPFAMEYHHKIFSGVPIVFLALDESELEGQKLLPGMTGVTTAMGLGSTIDLALQLHPDTKAVAVINEDQNFWWGVAHTELLRRQDKVKEIDIFGQPSAEMLQKIAALPPHTVVLFQLAPAGGTEPTISNYDVLTAAAQRLPTYSAWPLMCLNYGCIGGAYPRWEEDFRLAGNMVARLLSGERVEDIPVVHSANLQVRVDSRALRRWKISEAALPPGSLILYKEPTLWEHGKKYFLIGIGVIAIQALWLIGLLWQRARTRKAQAVLRESENRFRVMADTTRSLIWMCDEKGKVTYQNEQRLSFTGYAGVSISDAWVACVHPDDLPDVLETLSKGLKDQNPFSKDYRLRRQDGKYRWVFDVAAPRVNGDGSFAGFIGSAADITDQKMAREALEKVSGQLIAAQERERSHLARELHDDICQRLAMLSLRIEKASKGWGSGQKSVSEQLEEIWQQCSALTGDVQALSHELHPSILDNLGLVTGVKSFCRELSQQHGAVVDFTDRNIPLSLPREVSLSLFRVIQEALHNAIKYSGQKHFEVHLQGKADEIELEISDRGAGFDVASMRNGKGLGLVSMTERIHLLNGRISIDSKPNIGTTVRACVPLVTQPKAMAASAN